MTNLRAPDTLEPADTWRTNGLCRTYGTPDLWFPVGNTAPALAQAQEAASICRRCPVLERCLTWSLTTRQQHGVWGGIGEYERQRLLRRHRGLPVSTIVEAITAAPPSPPRTPRDVYAARTVQQPDGHATWTRSTTVLKVEGRMYTPRQLAFLVGRGRLPEGPVHAECGMPTCFALGHLADGRMRRANRAWRQDDVKEADAA